MTNSTSDRTLDSSDSESCAPTFTQEALLELWNLHDAFLNAHLMRKLMQNAPVVSYSEFFPASDRGRLERLWCALLAVLVECWHSERMLPAIKYAKSVTDMSGLVALLRQSRRDGTTDLLVECRHYMFHRDRRSYWDKGRQCPIGRLEANDRIHMAFSDVLLAATQHANDEAQRLGIHFPGPMASDLPWPNDGPANPTEELPE